MFEIGNSLREARMRRMLDLADAEHDTKIRLRYLSALEHEDFSVLPGAVYTRGFLRTYARYLGLDPQTYIDEYNARFGQFEDLEEPAPSLVRSTAHRGSRRRPLRWFLVVVLIALALLLWEGLRTHHRHVARETQVNSALTRSPATKGTGVGRNPALPAARTAATSATKAPTPTVAVLRLSAVHGATWVQVQRQSASGPIMFAGTLAKGTSKTFRGPQLFVSLGFASAATLSLPRHTVRPTVGGRATYLVLPTGIRTTT